MKKWIGWAGLVCLALFILAPRILKSAQGDYTTLGYDTANTRDVWRVNSSGHLIPGADNTYNIGSAANSVASLTVDGTATLATLAVTGGTTLSGALTLYSRTAAQILAIDPVVAGELYYCSNCTTTAVCVSTGTAVTQVAAIEDPTAVCG